MRRTVPLLIAATCGIVLIFTAFIPATVSWGETAAVWFDILAAIAFILGGGNLLKIHLKKVSDQKEGWAYSLITVLTFLLTLFVGLLKWDVSPSIDQEFYGLSFAPLTVEELPEDLTYSVDVALPAEWFEKELPASVRSQLSYSTEGEDVTQLQFRGWMTPGQQKDLNDYHLKLEWQCAVEQLAEKARPADPLAGEVLYFADHRALAARGPLSEDAEQALRDLDEGSAWTTAVDQLAERSRHVTTMAISDPPAAFPPSDEWLDRVEIVEGELSVTGPISIEMKNELADVFQHTRPLTPEQIQQFVDELKSLPGGLSEDQENMLPGLLESGWTADQLISAVDQAGVAESQQKSACDLLEERLAGETNLTTSLPPADSDVTLNDAQKSYLREAISDSSVTLTQIGPELASRGNWTDSQAAALDEFLEATPTIGERNRLLATALTQDDQTLSDEQYEFLLTPYREQHQWEEQMHALMMAAHQVKYSWSGNYVEPGSPFWWLYEYAFTPLTATMFSLLAFYVASAAFRAFRAKNFEAFLLLSTAFIILLGRTYAGPLLTSWLPESLAALKIENITVFIMSVINTAGNRAIMIGISLGIVSTSLKILLGVDRSYLGTGED
ncbi:hypothetical protein [Rubinisphaera margarita]|uniref:hypothetical protein n=1 Tax=Rubinisphaera margarita TaxID=2909586 RepID=UPI001EE8774F|nr:hypothetical protein [Rubinisphaera margarita]MCG6154685.1 hypothetical protein [Rubinisphaera margarita]